MEACIIIVALILLVLVLVVKGKREGYRDPLYLYPAKYQQDYYPRSRGDIYDCGDMFSGYNSYPKAY